MTAHRTTSDVFIVDGLRTPIGSSHKSLKDFSAADLAASVLKEFIHRYPSVCQHVDGVFLGNTVSAGTGQNVARQAIIFSGLSPRVPGTVVNSVCGSGLESIILGCRTMLCNEAQIICAGGTESATHSPKILVADNQEPIESLICDGLWCAMSGKHMGHIAENLALQYQISAEAQNQFAYESHVKAVNAQREGKFKEEIVVVPKKDGSLVDKDDRPRHNISLDRMEKLPAAFQSDGTVTAGNASAPGDAAALTLLISGQGLKKYPELKPKARILSYATVGIEPHQCFEAGVLAVRDCLSVAGVSLSDVDLFEIGESFAAQAVWTKEQLGLSKEKVNIYGGDIALGHPLGSTSARLLVTLMHALGREKKRYGLAVMCFGSGGATSMLIERL
ncbi:MAG TPA: thiolase family protein [Candidatus Omnitrophota bacterium]|nr:thiolase family protein [Candidatus Omnitrophota bacterium]